MNTRVGVVLLALAVLGAACGGGEPAGDDPSPVQPTPTQAATTTTVTPDDGGTSVGPDGGRVVSADGRFEVNIPAGALAELAAVRVSVMSPSDAGIDGALITGPIYSLEPDGLQFSLPVALTRTVDVAALQVGANEIPFFHVLHGTSDRWELLSTTTSRDGDQISVVAEASHFSMNVAVATTRLLGEDITATLFPGSFTANVGESVDTDVSFLASPLLREEVDENRGRTVFSSDGAVVSYGLDNQDPPLLLATCGDKAGTGTYTARFSGALGLVGPEAIIIALKNAFQEVVEAEGYTIAVTGNATCEEPDLSLVESVLGTWSGPVAFTPSPTGPPGVDYEAPFTVVISEVDGRFVITTTQLPSTQMTAGPLLPDSLVFGSSGGTSIFEVYVGGACRASGGELVFFGLTFGGPPELETRVTEAVAPTGIRFDPASQDLVLEDSDIPFDPRRCPGNAADALEIAMSLWPPDLPTSSTGAGFLNFFSGVLQPGSP